MTKFKAQNKSPACRQEGKCKMTNNKTLVLEFDIGISDFICNLDFSICH